MQFVQYMVTKRRFSIFMVVPSTLTVLSGALLIWMRGGGQWGEYVSSDPGLIFTLGSIARVGGLPDRHVGHQSKGHQDVEDQR
jgi:hypothetical protein